MNNLVVLLFALCTLDRAAASDVKTAHAKARTPVASAPARPSAPTPTPTPTSAVASGSAPDPAAKPVAPAAQIDKSIRPFFRAGGVLSVDDSTDFSDKLLAFAPSSKAVDAVNKIVSFTGLSQNFDIQPAAVPNAVAVFDGSKRMILYNPEFLNSLDNRVSSDWGVIGVLAHEVGHHLQGHTSSYAADVHRNELEADHFAGYVMSRMGATLEQSLATMNALAVEQQTPTHPAKSARVASITEGWEDAQRLARLSSSAFVSAPDTDVPFRQEAYKDAPSGPDNMVFVGRFRMERDKGTYYYITKGNSLLFRDKAGAFHIVGKKRPPRSPEFAWSLETPYVLFDIGFDGAATTVFPNGSNFKIGIVLAP